MIIYLPQSGRGMSAVEENEREGECKMKRKSPGAVEISIPVPKALISQTPPSIPSVTLMYCVANRQVSGSPFVSRPI